MQQLPTSIVKWLDALTYSAALEDESVMRSKTNAAVMPKLAVHPITTSCLYQFDVLFMC